MKDQLTFVKHTTLERSRHTKRVGVIGVLGALLIAITLCRMVQLQLVEGERYRAKAYHNQIDMEAIEPKRGLIYDRHGILLADNKSAFVLAIVPKQVDDLKGLLHRLKHIVDLSDKQIELFYKKRKYYKPHESIPLKSNLSTKETAQLHAHQLQLPGIRIQPRLMRFYPEGEALTPVLGYCNRITENDLKHIDAQNYKNALFIGRTGIEAYYESILHGHQGFRETEVNARGQPQRILNTYPPRSGATLTLTIDAKLQQVAYKAFGQESGAAVLIDPSNGEVLALISAPSMDGNLWTHGITPKEYQKLQKSHKRPLFNRALSGQFPPASTIKPFLALGALERGIIKKHTRVDDPGYFMLPGGKHRFRDWLPEGHGHPNVTEAIVFSCDTFFYHLGAKIVPAFLEDVLKPFGFGQALPIDLPHSKTGILSTPKWKRTHKHQPWYTGDTIISMIGQGNMLITPLQLANATAILANQGNGFYPHILKSSDQIATQPQAIPSIPITPEHWNIIAHAMERVITHPSGTGWRFGKAPYRIAGKTGTAQLFSNYGKRQDKINKKLRDHSWFIGFTPIQKPKLAIAVITENSSQASIIARRIVDAYYRLEKERAS